MEVQGFRGFGLDMNFDRKWLGDKNVKHAVERRGSSNIQLWLLPIKWNRFHNDGMEAFHS